MLHRRWPNRIKLATADLARHKALMTLKPLTDDAIREIVQDIVLPLIRRRAAG